MTSTSWRARRRTSPTPIDRGADAETSLAEISDLATPEQLLDLATELEDEDRVVEAAEMYRAALAAGGPCGHLLSARRAALPAGRPRGIAASRYYMAIELDEDYVEARANLACVLAELGQTDLAIAALEVRWHIITTSRMPTTTSPCFSMTAANATTARRHWEQFLQLAPDSPWADEARQRLYT